MKQSGIYRIVNVVNGKFYIGSAKRLGYREWCHFNRPAVSNIRLQHAMEKYGKENFKFEVLECVEDVTQLISREQFWIDEAIAKGKELYNISLVAGSNIGSKRSEEAKARMRMSHIGKRATLETRALMRRTHLEMKTERPAAFTMKGKHHSEDTRNKISLARLGFQPSTEVIRKMSESHKGKCHSEDTRKKMSLGLLVYWQRKRALKEVIKEMEI